MFAIKKTQILIEFLNGTKKVQLAAKKKFPSPQKKFSKGLEDFATIFGKLTAPYVMFESKKTLILIEFLDGTKKVQLAGKKSFLVAKQSSPRV